MKDFIMICVFYLPILSSAQEFHTQSTDDLSFLIGEWDIKRTYSPAGEEPRNLKGSLVCKWSLDSSFIECKYEIERPGKKRVLDLVFFNYNPIYKEYESAWLSSTWPIKVIMHGNMTDRHGRSFTYTANFPIENGVVEYVESRWLVNAGESSTSSFSRKTFIKTSDDNDWIHHMNEEAIRVKPDSK